MKPPPILPSAQHLIFRRRTSNWTRSLFLDKRIVGRVVAILLALVVVVSNQADEVRSSVDSFLITHCGDCHFDGANEGGLRIDELSRDLQDPLSFVKWQRIHDRIDKGEMPPKDVASPSQAQIELTLARLGSSLKRAHASRRGTVYRRLNRREYENTINDLLGTHLDLANMLPEDGRSHEFDNIGHALSMSHVQLQKYMEAAELALNTAIASSVRSPEPVTKVANYAETREGESHIGKAWGQAPDGAVIFFRELGYPSGMLRTANVRKHGRYRIKVTGYAFRSENPITFKIGGTSFQRGSRRPTFGYFSVNPGNPQTIDLEAWIDKNYMIEITPWGISDLDNEIRKNGIEAYKGPGLAINQVELTGPLIDQFPSRGHRLIFDGIQRTEVEPRNPRDKTKSWYVPKFEITTDNPVGVARESITRVASAAFRRPVASSDIQDYVDLFQGHFNGGATFEESLKVSIIAILCSPDFLFLNEPKGELSDYALASRLSYFLSRTSPDSALLSLAQTGQLADPSTLLAQTRRLLQDPRNDRLITDFTDAWLNLRDIEFTAPDRNLFPEFDQYLQHSMLRETRQFFATLIRDDRPIRDLVAPNFAMLNNRLAEHYGIEGVVGPEIRKVTLGEASVRGGLLGQCSIHKVSANGTNTSPVVRGVWVMERILGDPPDPPPPGVPGVEPDVRGAETLRQLLAKHRSSDNCNSCHRKIDPPGFALESFNPIGGWRQRYRNLAEGERVQILVRGRNVRYRLGPNVDAR